MADERIVIDASAFESIDYDTFFTTYFSGLGNGTRKFYGDVSSGMYGYVTGDQVGINWSTTTVGSKYVLIEGEDIAYDGRLPNNGHGYSGSIDTITFGSVGADTVIAPDTPASGQPRGLISGVVPGLVISNLGVSMPEGNNLSGVDPADAATYNELYAYLTLIRDIDKGSNLANYVKLLYDSLATHAQHFIGTDGNDKYTGTAFGDLIEGGDGDDVIDGGGGDDIFVLDGNRADYTITDDGNGVFTVSGGTTGEDKLENVEYLRFNDLTYDLRDGSINYVPTDLAISATAIEGDSDVDTIVGKLTVTDLENVGGAPDVHTFELIDTADGMFKVDGQGNIRVAGDLAVGDRKSVV